MHRTIAEYNDAQEPAARETCTTLMDEITRGLAKAESRIWHRHPVWFLDGNPIVGYSVQKAGVRLMFWSGADFDEAALDVVGKKFKDATNFYAPGSAVDTAPLRRWLRKSKTIQWDYKNIVKRKGVLVRIA